jgi:cob(I)alamin adenosyltransferase
MAIRINRVYTRTGDDGLTSLVGGDRVSKNHPRVDAYGEVDELNSVLGLVRSSLGSTGKNASGMPEADNARLQSLLGRLQQELFDLGSEEHIAWLEQQMDELQEDLEELKSFVLPGGGETGARLHLARTVCRRAERKVIGLADNDTLPAGPVRYLNRLSDLLFVMSRWAARKSGIDETLWQHGLEGSRKED